MTKIKVELQGIQQLIAKMEALGDDADMVILKTITDLTLTTKRLAQKGIQSGPKSGVTYHRIYDAEKGYMRIYAGGYSEYGPNKIVAVYKSDGGGNLSPTHRASAPGQYPATDTGRLASSVMVNLPTPASMTGEVGTNVLYGKWLEFGTTRMAARPWLLPSFTQAKIGIEKKLRDNLEARI
jgi:hypothetical protein